MVFSGGKLNTVNGKKLFSDFVFQSERQESLLSQYKEYLHSHDRAPREGKKFRLG